MNANKKYICTHKIMHVYLTLKYERNILKSPFCKCEELKKRRTCNYMDQVHYTLQENIHMKQKKNHQSTKNVGQ